MRKILTEYFAAMSNSTTVAQFCPATGAIDTTGIINVSADVELSGLGNLQAKAAARFSIDGVNWGTAVGIPGHTYQTALGMNFADADGDLHNATGYDEYVQFGLLCESTGASTVEQAVARMFIYLHDVAGPATHRVPYRRVAMANAGVQGAAVFHPMTGPIVAEDINRARVVTDLAASTGGGLTLQIGWQEGDNPLTSGGGDWGSVNTIGSAFSTLGVSGGGSFTTISPSKRYVRFGYYVVHTTLNALGLAIVGMRVDVRTLG